MIEQANDGDGCKLFATTYTFLDFHSLDRSETAVIYQNNVGSNGLAKNGGTCGFALVASRLSLKPQ